MLFSGLVNTFIPCFSVSIKCGATQVAFEKIMHAGQPITFDRVEMGNTLKHAELIRMSRNQGVVTHGKFELWFSLEKMSFQMG